MSKLNQINNNPYRVLALSEYVIEIYNSSKKPSRNKIINNITPPFDTIIIFSNHHSITVLETKFFRNGRELRGFGGCYDFNNYPSFDFPIELLPTNIRE